jgi:glycosyltransferase involved in cell wall biosynthesis
MALNVKDGLTGLHFNPGDSADLAEKVSSLIASPARFSNMRLAARREYESFYTAERNYSLIMQFYGEAIALHQTRIARNSAAQEHAVHLVPMNKIPKA